MRFGLIGCGGIGKLRADAIQHIPSCKLVAVCDIVSENARHLSNKYQSELEQDWHSLITRNDIDAVIVSTPPHLHAEMCVEALKAGKHVLCEKPLARNLQECEAILSAEKESNRFLATGFNYRFYPSVMKARELFDSGIIGELDHIRSYTGYSATDHSQAWLHDANIMGGGALRDNGIHLIDLTYHFLGDVTEIMGMASNSVWKFDGCEDNGFTLLKNRQGKVASLQASWTEWRGYRLRIDIYGSKGYITIRCFPMITNACWTDKDGKQQKKSFFFPKTFVMEHLRSYQWVVTESFVREIQSFINKVDGKPSLIASGNDGLQAVRIAQTASNTSSIADQQAVLPA